MYRSPLLLVFLALFNNAIADINISPNSVQVGRYSSIDMSPTVAQSDPLQAVVEISFSPSVDTVGSAIDNLLLDSGFQMAQLSASDPKLPILLRQPLPLVHRSIGPTKLITALEFLAGSPWILVIDPVNRLVSYELATVYTTGEQ